MPYQLVAIAMLRRSSKLGDYARQSTLRLQYCHRTHMPEPNPNGYTHAVREQAVR